MHELELLRRGELGFSDRDGIIFMSLDNPSRDTDGAPGTPVLSTIFKDHRAWEETPWINGKVRHGLSAVCGGGRRWRLRMLWLLRLLCVCLPRSRDVKSDLLRAARRQRGTWGINSLRS